VNATELGFPDLKRRIEEMFGIECRTYRWQAAQGPGLCEAFGQAVTSEERSASSRGFKKNFPETIAFVLPEHARGKLLAI
jgi:hypothetical protein